MDESVYEIDQHQLAEGCRRFPARRAVRHHPASTSDLGFLREPGDFAPQAWDEAGHL